MSECMVCGRIREDCTGRRRCIGCGWEIVGNVEAGAGRVEGRGEEAHRLLCVEYGYATCTKPRFHARSLNSRLSF